MKTKLQIEQDIDNLSRSGSVLSDIASRRRDRPSRDLGPPIGTTTSGKPVHEHAISSDYNEFTAEDHMDAANIHNDFAGEHRMNHKFQAHMKIAREHERRAAVMKRGSQHGTREISSSTNQGNPKVTNSGIYYVVDRNHHRTLYGPYNTRQQAELASYFNKPVADRDSTPLHILFAKGVQTYTKDEIEAFVHSPKEWGLKSVKISRKEPPMHPSWKELSAEFRQYLRDSDQEQA